MNQQPDPRAKRPEFLIETYKQMMADINRHITVVWQAIGIVIGSFAVMGLVEKKVLSLDFAVSLLVGICAWSLALTLDSSYWYNRNLCIIANIERLFLRREDLREVHYYFGAHRPTNRMITTLRVQTAFSLGIASLVILYHFLVQVAPYLKQPWSSLDPLRAIPYIVGIICSALLLRFRTKRNADYDEFLRNSPGIDVDREGIDYGGGHGFDQRNS
jgi:hypothetical protein